MKFYAGKVPLANGNYQRIVLREAVIHKVQTNALDVTGKIAKNTMKFAQITKFTIS